MQVSEQNWTKYAGEWTRDSHVFGFLLVNLCHNGWKSLVQSNSSIAQEGPGPQPTRFLLLWNKDQAYRPLRPCFSRAKSLACGLVKLDNHEAKSPACGLVKFCYHRVTPKAQHTVKLTQWNVSLLIAQFKYIPCQQLIITLLNYTWSCDIIQWYQQYLQVHKTTVWENPCFHIVTSVSLIN